MRYETIRDNWRALYAEIYKKENENPVSKDICADHNGFVITLFAMSLALAPPSTGAALLLTGVVAHNVQSSNFCAFRVDGDVLVVCFSVAQYRYPDRRPANSGIRRECSCLNGA